jgi:hypothetical protein
MTGRGRHSVIAFETSEQLDELFIAEPLVWKRFEREVGDLQR